MDNQSYFECVNNIWGKSTLLCVVCFQTHLLRHIGWDIWFTSS
jgi:hypothetical protein